MGKKFGAEPIRDRNTDTDNGKNGYYMDHPCEEEFVCRVCGKKVMPEGAGSDHRNHCPNCLSSIHVDNVPGDRLGDCKGTMDPIAVWVRPNGEWAIIHRCRDCGRLRSNRIAADDNPVKLMSIAMKPIANPPFPIERMEDMLKAMENRD
jgi:DNA-directed RNA polymerase subunit RPC12/RpoP